MRINRQKKVHRYLSFYANNFGFRKPYQILIDGTFCHTALKAGYEEPLKKGINCKEDNSRAQQATCGILAGTPATRGRRVPFWWRSNPQGPSTNRRTRVHFDPIFNIILNAPEDGESAESASASNNKNIKKTSYIRSCPQKPTTIDTTTVPIKERINLSDQLPNYLDDEVKMLTTPCAIIETEKLGPAVYGAMLILKQFAVHKCGHSEPIPAAACFKTMLRKKNKNRYMIATQDRELQSRVRMIPATPLLYIHRKAPILEPPSPATVNASNKKMQQSIVLSDVERKNLKIAKESLLGPQQPVLIKRKKKRAKGPNPLSCKKKKTDPSKSKASNGKKKKKVNTGSK